MTIHWGMLAPENVKPSRRRLTLGLGRAVMLYNEAAVPGLGGIWFIRQAALALLGIRVAEESPYAGSKIEVANAIEALACWIGYQERDWSRGDWRLRGPRKLKSLQDRGMEQTFRRLKSPSSYVTQPMRMSCVEALPGLGLVDASGSRFNSFSVNIRGQQLIDAVFGERGQGRLHLPDYLRDWVLDKPVNFTSSLRRKLNPTTDAGDDARIAMREALAFPGAGAERRRNALVWMRRIDRGDDFGTTPDTDWGNQPAEIDDNHWKDLRAGAALLQTRDAAIGVLANIEQELVAHSRLDLTRALPEGVSASLEAWRKEAQRFLALDGHGPIDAAAAAREFCTEALQSDVHAITMLVNRENHMLRVTGSVVVPTAAWRTDAALRVDDATHEGSDIETDPEGREDDSPMRAERDVLPPSISPRIIYLRRLSLDLEGRLGTFIEAQGQN
ncbi:hypothetical protein [Actibacterium lipolyticum]|uniref:Uncharacterized protein n=1 Tax=Actibacterium lipolyticum TaxID=1524263 RepID=A0A238L7H1_9RHOB|nr:hypothetical protein [Actibacterium lipolyticum]SMX50947.1 hypothetical protein COL8621_03477 [Actibacterium lipolyticum]